MEYLGYVLSPSGLTMSDTKVKTIQEWPELKKIKDIQSFLGFANFYRCFIFDYSDIVILLTRFTRKNTPWNFDNNCRVAFNTLKQAFTSTFILIHWVPDTQLVVKTCHDLVKQLSHYLYFFSFLFLFLFFHLELTIQKEVRESVTSQVSHSHSHMTGSHSITSHDVT